MEGRWYACDNNVGEKTCYINFFMLCEHSILHKKGILKIYE